MRPVSMKDKTMPKQAQFSERLSCASIVVLLYTVGAVEMFGQESSVQRHGLVVGFRFGGGMSDVCSTKPCTTGIGGGLNAGWAFRDNLAILFESLGTATGAIVPGGLYATPSSSECLHALSVRYFAHHGGRGWLSAGAGVGFVHAAGSRVGPGAKLPRLNA